jgi:hypothetical protein
VKPKLELVPPSKAQLQAVDRRYDPYVRAVIDQVRRGRFHLAALVLAATPSFQAFVMLRASRHLTAWQKERLIGALRKRVVEFA